MQMLNKPTQASELFLVPARAVPSIWPLAHDYLVEACKSRGGEYTAEMLLDECFTGNSQLWLAWSDERGCESACVTGILPHCKVCLIKACGGKNRDNWLFMLDEIEAWAKTQGCMTMRLFGREGWSRVLKDYRKTRVVLDKEIK